MHKFFSGFVLLLCFVAPSCTSQPEFGNPIVDPVIILKDAPGFVKYYYPLLNLEEDFIALDKNSKPMDKTVFFEALLMGTYLPLKQQTKTNTYYRLYKMRDNVSENISATIKSIAYYAFKNHEMQGKTIRGFNFTDIKGNKFDSINIKGKIIVLKFWFIKCGACVAEMPDLNGLVKKYEHNNVIFLSFASDTKKQLQQFLTTQVFKYKVIADQNNLVKSLNITAFPTHVILNEEGRVVKAVGKFKDLEVALKKYMLK